MTIQGAKRILLKAAGAAVLAGTLLAVSPAAEAQQFAVGVQFGAPAYGYNYGPAYGRGYYDHLRWEREQAAIARHDAWIRHEEWRRREDWRYRHDGYVPRPVPYGYGWR